MAVLGNEIRVVVPGAGSSGLSRADLVAYARKNPLSTLAIAVIVLVVFLAAFGAFIAPYHANVPSGRDFVPPSLQHVFGTDNEGRDVLSRVIVGAQASLWASLGSVLLGSVVGTLIGLISGYYGGWVDMVIQRVIDAVMGVPLILIAVVIVSVLSPTLTNIIIALGIILAPNTARVVRGSTLAMRHELYVESARAVGCRDRRILFRYVLPNVLAPIIVVGTIAMGSTLIAVASLSFLGLTDPTQITWGGMLSIEGRSYMLIAPWIGIFPGVALTLTVLAFNLAGDALRDLLDPRQRG